jgi:hypothetical protein
MSGKSRLAPCAVLGTLVVLSGCGGGGGGAPDRAPTAAALAQTMNWNAAADVDVLAGASDADGDKLTVTGVTQPAHGTVSLAAGKVTYQPKAGFFGTDSFDYTVGDGRGAQATGTVNVTVQAVMTLKGQAVDAPLPGAAVTATVGDKTFTATADSTGHYVLTVTTSDPAAFIGLSAQGAGGQSQVKLVSLVGDVATTAGAASPDGSVDANAASALTISNVSTAMAALATAANKGTAPTTQAQLKDAKAQVDADALLQMAAVVKLVADKGVALPAGVKDTAALVANTATYNAFAQKQVMGNADALASAAAEIARDPALSVQPPASVDASLTRDYYVGRGGGAGDAVEVTLNPDKTARVTSTQSTHAGTWATTDDGLVKVTYDQPEVISDRDFSITLPDGSNPLLEVRNAGVQIRQQSGDTQAGVATISTFGTNHYPNGEHADTPIDDPGASYVFGDGASYTAPTVDELTAAPHAGVVTREIDPVTWNQSQDTLIVAADGTGHLDRTGATFTWKRTDAQLLLTFANGVQQSIVRTARRADGEERWLTRVIESGAPTSVHDALVVAVMPGLSFTADNVVDRWRSDLLDGLVTDPIGFIHLLADGTGMGEQDHADGTPAGTFGTPLFWRIDGGRMVADSAQLSDGSWAASCPPEDAGCVLKRERTWTKLATSGAETFVFEHQWINGVVDQFRTNRYDSTQPATSTGSSAKTGGQGYRYFPLKGAKPAAHGAR